MGDEYAFTLNIYNTNVEGPFDEVCIVSAAIEIYGLNLGDGSHRSSKTLWDQWRRWRSRNLLPDPNFSYHFGTPTTSDIFQLLDSLLLQQTPFPNYPAGPSSYTFVFTWRRSYYVLAPNVAGPRFEIYHDSQKNKPVLSLGMPRQRESTGFKWGEIAILGLDNQVEIWSGGRFQLFSYHSGPAWGYDLFSPHPESPYLTID